MNMDNQAFRAPLPEELAELFPSYRIISLIATGGMGAVYHAIQTSLDREVAIKILPVESGRDPEYCKAFAAEARAMAKLTHPNLIGVYDFGEVNGTLFIVMEYVPGKSLHEACSGAAVDPTEVIRLMTGISHGLAHAHQHGVLHRDIKPANILLDAHLQPKIGDFGLARPLDAQTGEGEPIFGTPGYTAPEVLTPPHTVDERADIFSLGVLLHELLTGLVPGSDPIPLPAITHCDPRFEAVVRKATHPDPQQRYQSAAEIADALQTIASSSGPRVLKTASKTAARRRAPHAPAMHSVEKGGGGKVMVMILLLVLIALAALYLRHRLSRISEAEQPRLVQKQVQVVVPKSGPPAPEPQAVHPEPAPVEPEPTPVEPEPAAAEAVTVESAPEAVVPEPMVSGTATGPDPAESVARPQPKFDVDAFLQQARSVMAKRCAADIAKRDAALGKNLSDFKSDALRLMKQNLDQIHHAAGEDEIAAFVDMRRSEGNRMGEGLINQLKFKEWLVELHKDYQKKEEEIDEDVASALSQHRKTYLYGLGLRVKALREADDPVAVELIKAEMEKVSADADYFSGLMAEANKD